MQSHEPQREAPSGGDEQARQHQKEGSQRHRDQDDQAGDERRREVAEAGEDVFELNLLATLLPLDHANVTH